MTIQNTNIFLQNVQNTVQYATTRQNVMNVHKGTS